MTESVVLYAVAGRIATITLDRPQRGNALSIALLHELRAALQAAQRDPEVGVILLRANGRHFCTGADLGWAGARQHGDDARWREGNDALVALLHELYGLTRPVVARVQGTVLGGAVALLSLCDDVVALRDASWHLPELKLGLVPSAIVPVLRQITTPAALRRVLYDETPWTSVDAQGFGIVTRVGATETLDALVRNRLDSWLDLPPDALAATKRWLRELDADDFFRALRLGREHAASL
ncbi:hypothetical protein BTH42_12780 [Burkholderia sp. SRS-W-2-2016]|nr:hypothetical protein BTH42_12780 [Burkholderia sp. SRS-W-2-2016]